MFSKHLTALLLCLLAACAGTRQDVIRQFLDEESTVVVTTLTEPLLMKHSGSQFAANIGDYVHVRPVEVNRGGDLNHFLVLAFWSTIDRQGAAPRANAQQVFVLVDGQPIELKLSARSEGDHQHGLSLVSAGVPARELAWYGITRSQLAAIADAHQVSLVASIPGLTRYHATAPMREPMGTFVDYTADGVLR